MTLQTGRVIAAFSRRFIVETPAGSLPCQVKGRHLQVVCGDRVELRRSGDTGVIEAVLPRASLLYRSDAFKSKAIAANVTVARTAIPVPPPEATGLTQAEIPAWLEALRPTEEAAAPKEAETPSETEGPLAGIANALPPAPGMDEMHGLSAKLQFTVSAEDQARAGILKELLTQHAVAPAAVEQFVVKGSAVRRRALRWIVAFLIIAALLVPIGNDLNKLTGLPLLPSATSMIVPPAVSSVAFEVARMASGLDPGRKRARGEAQDRAPQPLGIEVAFGKQLGALAVLDEAILQPEVEPRRRKPRGGQALVDGTAGTAGQCIFLERDQQFMRGGDTCHHLRVEWFYKTHVDDCGIEFFGGFKRGVSMLPKASNATRCPLRRCSALPMGSVPNDGCTAMPGPVPRG